MTRGVKEENLALLVTPGQELGIVKFLTAKPTDDGHAQWTVVEGERGRREFGGSRQRKRLAVLEISLSV